MGSESGVSRVPSPLPTRSNRRNTRHQTVRSIERQSIEVPRYTKPTQMTSTTTTSITLIPHQIIQVHYQAIRNLFRWFDKDGDGIITIEDLDRFFNSNHDQQDDEQRVSQQELSTFVQEVLTQGNDMSGHQYSNNNNKHGISFSDLLGAINAHVKPSILELCQRYREEAEEEAETNNSNNGRTPYFSLVLEMEIEQIYSEAFAKFRLLERTADRLRCFYNMELPGVQRVIQRELTNWKSQPSH